MGLYIKLYISGAFNVGNGDDDSLTKFVNLMNRRARNKTNPTATNHGHQDDETPLNSEFWKEVFSTVSLMAFVIVLLQVYDSILAHRSEKEAGPDGNGNGTSEGLKIEPRRSADDNRLSEQD
jgi:hypothetical protein